jgi:hypothetical protein
MMRESSMLRRELLASLWLSQFVFLDSYTLDFLPYIEFTIISDRKAIPSQLLSSLSVLGFIFKHIFISKN